MHARVFISHHNSSGRVAGELNEYLESVGFTCWMAPRDIRPGEDWAEAILNGLDRSDILILMVSPEALKSKHVSRELAFALDKGIPVIKFHLPGTDISRLESFSKDEQALNVECDKGIQDGFAILKTLLLETETQIRRKKKRLPKTVRFGLFLIIVALFLLILLSRNSSNKPKYPESMCFVQIPAGTFLMGSPEDEQARYGAEGPVHEVVLGSFEMMTTEVTQEMWHDVIGTNLEEIYNSQFKDESGYLIPAIGDKYPMSYVSWTDAVAFGDSLNLLDTLYTYRLPTESEWEYACRAGNQGRNYSTGSDLNIDSISWHFANSGNTAHAVATLQPNDWGLYDMLGNINEWCGDAWHNDYTGAPGDGSIWGEQSNGFRVRRGSSFISSQGLHRSAFRDRSREELRHHSLGFRLVRIPR